MNKFLVGLFIISLTACSQYKDEKLLCVGDIEKNVDGRIVTEKHHHVVLKIKDDNIRLSKNSTTFKEWIKVCDNGSHPLATKEQIYFNVNGCNASVDENGLAFEGTYNITTKKLDIKQKSFEENFAGHFTCETGNLSQKDFKITH